MPAKRPAPKSAKGKKAASRPAVRKPAAHRPEPVRVRAVAAPPRKIAPPPRRPAAAASEPVAEARKPLRPGAPTPPPAPATANLTGNRLAPAPAVPAVPAVPAASADGDDVELVEPGSLLAGPRNVQPYIAKRGEQYMSKDQLDHFRNILNSWKRDLMVEVDRTVSHMKDEAANFPDPNDRATQEEEFSLELRTRDRERKLIRKIDDALKRIDDGSYGYCLETGEEIGIKRLEARPVATLSIEAQERRERRERQYGDRDDRYR
jgi:DnaK suppressor protein